MPQYINIEAANKIKDLLIELGFSSQRADIGEDRDYCELFAFKFLVYLETLNKKKETKIDNSR